VVEGAEAVPTKSDALAAVLGEIGAVRERVDQLEWAVVDFMRSCGVTWEDVGDALGISRQAARSRFSKPKRRRG